MGLFSKKQPQEQQKADPVVKNKWERISVNLTDKMLRVELDGDTARTGHTSIKQRDNFILLVADGIIIAEISKRGGAYKELEPYIGNEADHMEIEAKEGDYGYYYRTSLLFKYTIVES